jgi:hypothetical protein
MYRPKPRSTAHPCDVETHTAQITHPFHPLTGKVLEVVDRGRCIDGEIVFLEHEDDRVIRIPAAWTSLGPIDELVVLSGGRSPLRVDDLLRLSELVDELREGGGEEVAGHV